MNECVSILVYLMKPNKVHSFNGSNCYGPLSMHENLQLLLSTDSVLYHLPKSNYWGNCIHFKLNNKPFVSMYKI